MKRLLLMFAVLVSCTQAAYAGELPEGAATLTLSLKPANAMYSLDEAMAGNVTISARFTNAGDDTVFLAHPSVCVPESYGPGDTFSFDSRHGRSEILLYIRKPDGALVVLRNNVLRGFEPGNRFHLDIAPGGSEEIRLGWLGPDYALGQWDGFAGPLFDQRGMYGIRMLYRNQYGKALSFGEGADIFAEYTPWTGEVGSGTVTIIVE